MQSVLILLWLMCARSAVALRRRLVADEGPRDRGDVPGWVLITVMSAGLVAGLWALAGDKLQTMLTTALDSVTGT